MPQESVQKQRLGVFVRARDGSGTGGRSDTVTLLPADVLHARLQSLQVLSFLYPSCRAGQSSRNSERRARAAGGRRRPLWQE